MKRSLVSVALNMALLPAVILSHTTHAEQVTPDSDKKIETIMVTGQKIARSLQETTTSVAVLTPEQLEQQQINSFDDVMINIANTHSDNNRSFSIRGIDGFNVSGGGNSFLASIYVDGAPLPADLVRAGAFSTWDAQQIEVLRGPQSTLQGRNALAGAVILNTQNPTYDWQGKYKLTVGSHGHQDLGVAIGGGIVDEQLAFRFSAEETSDDGTVKNTFDNSDASASDEHTYRLKFLYEPTNLEGFSAQLSLMNAERSYGTTTLAIAEGQNPFENRITVFNDPRRRKTSSDLASLTLQYDIDDHLSIASYTTYSTVDTSFVWDSDYVAKRGIEPTVDTGSTRSNDSNIDTLSQELRLTFDYDSFSGVLGGYYFNADSESTSTGLNHYQLSRFGLSSDGLQAQFKLPKNIADLVYSQYDAFNPATTEIYTQLSSEVTSYALFADGVWHLNNQWDLLAGIRFDKEKQSNANDAKYTILNQDKMPNPANYAGTPLEGITPLIAGINNKLLAFAAQASKTAPMVDASFNTLLPKIGASYHINDNATASFTYQKGYRSGGVGVNQATSQIFEYDAEYTDNYELSYRSTWLDNKLTVNANLFYIDWKDQQVDVQLSTNTYDRETKNAGSSKVQGFELELNYLVSNNLTAYAAIGYSGTEFTNFKISIPVADGFKETDLSGRRFMAPQRTHNLGLTYQADNGFFTNLNLNYASNAPTAINPERNGDKPGDPYYDLHNDARTLVNLQIGYEWESVGVYLIGKNLLDEEYFTSNGVRNPDLGKPREFALNIRGVFDL